MRTATRLPCPECGQHNGPGVTSCEFCGDVLRRSPELRPAPREPHVHSRTHELEVAGAARGTFAGLRAEPVEPVAAPWIFLGVGLVVAPLFNVTPLLKYMGWFLASLVHEMGHCTMSWLAGSWAFPAISLRGHAMATHGPQSLTLCLVIWGLLVCAAWFHRDRKTLRNGFAAAALLYPLFAFTGVRDVMFLLAGHLGELAFAGIFFWRAIVGGFSSSPVERGLYATLAWLLLGLNLWLCGGLIWSADVKAWYAQSGSFGLTNDYLRLANDVLRVRLELIAVMMLGAALTVLPVAWLCARPYRLSPRK